MTEQPDRLNKAAVQTRFDDSPFISTLGLEVVGLDYESTEITVRMPMAPTLERKAGTGQFHGGPLAAFIDVVGDFALGMMLGGGVPTINLRIDYLKPAFGTAVTAVARVRRQGRSVAVIDIDVSDEKGSLVAVGRGTYAPLVG
jgi:uncharacterized protein (TIGR00369 family)